MSSARSQEGETEFYLGKAAWNMGQFDRAQKHFDQAIDKGYRGLDAVLMDGMASLRAGNEIRALERFNVVAEQNHSYTQKKDALIQLALIHAMREDFEESQKKIEQALKTDKNDAELNTQAGAIYLWWGDQLKVKAGGEEYESNQKYIKAGEYFQKALSSIGNDSALSLKLYLHYKIRRLQLSYTRCNISDLEADFNQLIQVSPAANSVEECAVLMLAFFVRRRFKEAQDAFFNFLVASDKSAVQMYKSLPYHLKHDVFAALVSWPSAEIDKGGIKAGSQTGHQKEALRDLLSVRPLESYQIRMMQINAGAIALSPESLHGQVLYIKQGWTTPGLQGGTLASLANELNVVLDAMYTSGSETINRAPALQAHLNIVGLESLPLLYKFVFDKAPPVLKRVGFFSGAANQSADVSTSKRFGIF